MGVSILKRDVLEVRKDFSGMTEKAITRYASDVRELYSTYVQARIVVLGLIVGMMFGMFGVWNFGIWGLSYAVTGCLFGGMLSYYNDHKRYFTALMWLKNDENEAMQSALMSELAKLRETA